MRREPLLPPSDRHGEVGAVTMTTPPPPPQHKTNRMLDLTFKLYCDRDHNMAHVRSYRPNVRVGNWNEDMHLAEEELRDFLERKERGELAVQKSSFLKENMLRQINLTVSTDGGLHMGDTVMLVNMGDSSRERATVSIDADAGGLTRPPAGPALRAPCGVSAGPSVRPCTRTAFTIGRYTCTPTNRSMAPLLDHLCITGKVLL
ncbi:hypothetical protein CRUP_037962 [Coryphaenoides rupestris]|nr:hypothetical protein CRUP_037962 [Coryphaenoides rupestris]